MSIVAFCLRQCAVQALRGRTMAGPNVFDSKIESIDDLAGELKSGAFVVVYTDQDDLKLEGFGNALNSGRRRLDFTIDLGVAARFQAEDGETGYEVGETDASREMAIDLLAYDVLRVLQGSSSPFADCFRTLMGTVLDIRVRRGAAADKGVRFAAREICLTLDAADDPVTGTEISEEWRRILDMLAAVEGLGGRIDMLERRLKAEPGEPDWRLDQAALGLTDAATAALGLTPVEDNRLLSP